MAKTDKELFREYLNSKARPEHSETVFNYYLTGHECFGIDEMLEGVVNSILNADPKPVEELDFLMEELGGLLQNLARVKDGFIQYQASQAEGAA